MGEIIWRYRNYKEFKKLKKSNNPVKTWSEVMSRYISMKYK